MMTVDAAQEKGCPENQACPDEKLSGNVPFKKGHRGGAPEDVNVHEGDGGNKNESEHWPSTGVRLFALKIKVSCQYVNFLGFEDMR